MKPLQRYVALACVTLLSACDGAPNEPVQPAAAEAAASDDEWELPPFVGRVWVSVTPGHARGSILVFLPDKSVLRDSCFETFRVSQWGIVSESRIRWIEDSIPIEAEYSQPSANELVLHPVGTGQRENYVAISVPYVCPDMPR